MSRPQLLNWAFEFDENSKGRKLNLLTTFSGVLIVTVCLHLSLHGAQALSPEEFVDLIDQGQKYNHSLISSVKGIINLRKVKTAEGQKFEAARIKAMGKPVPFELRGPFTKPKTTFSHSSVICFDGQKVKWGEPGHKYAYNGKTAYEYVPGENLPQAFIIDPKKIFSRKKNSDPRCWTAIFSEGTLKDWIKGITEEYVLKIKETTEKNAQMYEVRLEFKTGFVQTMRIAPQRGYQIVESIMTDNHGEPRQKIMVDFIQSPTGGWLPKKRTVQWYRILRENEPAVLTRTDESVLEKFEFVPVEEKEFSLDGLGVPVGTLVMDELTDTDFVFGVPTITDEIISEAIEKPDVQYAVSKQKPVELQDVLLDKSSEESKLPNEQQIESTRQPVDVTSKILSTHNESRAMMFTIIILGILVIVLFLLLIFKRRK